MQRTIKAIFCIALLTLGGQQAWGFALLGPSLGPDAYQTTELGYNLSTFDVGAPKNIGQGYRRNTPYIYYAYDQNFLEFFSTNGEAAVDSAFGVMNALTNADNMQLSQFPFLSRESFDASAFDLFDLKSYTLGAIVEQIGLAPSVRYTWTLHDRFIPAGATCSTNPALNGTEYLITQRNYDPVSQIYSSYVNGTLYSYELFESCGNINHFPDDFITGLTIDSLAVPYPTDSTANNLDGTYTPVSEAIDVLSEAGAASGLNLQIPPGIPKTLPPGAYYTGLTYDDAGGYHYLYSTNNINVENPVPGSQVEQTNFTSSTILQTMNLADLLEFSQTNSAAAIEARFPGIDATLVATYQTLVTNYNVTATLVPLYGAPAGSPGQLVVTTNGFTLSTQNNFVYDFGNIVIVHEYSNSVAQVQTVQGYIPPGSVPGTPPLTNTTYQTIILSNVISGDFYIIPDNSCGFAFKSTIVSNYLAGVTTNVIASAVNSAGFVGSQSVITYFTNDWYNVYACSLTTPGPEQLEGVGKINFVKSSFDSLTGQLFPAITNYYTNIMVINSQPVIQVSRRLITQPDILLDGEDLASPNVAQIGTGYPPFARTVTYTQDPQPPGAEPQSGPGTITDDPTTISYNTAGPIYEIAGNMVNAQYSFLGEESIFTWATFDSSTNPATVYPVGQTLQNLESQILVSVTPATLPDATNGVPYSQTFTSTGGGFTSTQSWSLGFDPVKLKQTALPTGLTLSTTGTLSGTPTNNADGPYDFVLQMTDSNGRSVTWPYTINIDQ